MSGQNKASIIEFFFDKNKKNIIEKNTENSIFIYYNPTITFLKISSIQIKGVSKKCIPF